jgi:DEAD/DEAH box helicase domain-containing protein
VIDALRGLGIALETVATFALMCEPNDIGRTLGDGESSPDETPTRLPGRNPHSGRTGGLDPTLFLFDALPGGVGLAPRIFERAEELVKRARDLILSCPCDAGCPACVGPAEGVPRKHAALDLIARLHVPAIDGFEQTPTEALPARAAPAAE